MNKRALGLGFLLLVAGIILAYASVQSIFSNMPNYMSTTQTVAVQPRSGFLVPIRISNASILQIVYNASFPVNFFLTNSTARYLLPQSNSTAWKVAYLPGNGLLYEIDNSTHGIFPYIANMSLSQVPSFWYRNQTVVDNGTYYAVFQNYGNKSNTVFYTMLNRSIASLASSEQNYSYGNIVLNISSTLAVIAGIIIMFYASFMKPKNVEEAESREADRLYASIGRKPGVKRMRPKRKARRKAKGRKREA